MNSQVWKYFDKTHPIVLARKISFIKRFCDSLCASVGYKIDCQTTGDGYGGKRGATDQVPRDEVPAVFHGAHELTGSPRADFRRGSLPIAKECVPLRLLNVSINKMMMKESFS